MANKCCGTELTEYRVEVYISGSTRRHRGFGRSRGDVGTAILFILNDGQGERPKHGIKFPRREFSIGGDKVRGKCGKEPE